MGGCSLQPNAHRGAAGYSNCTRWSLVLSRPIALARRHRFLDFGDHEFRRNQVLLTDMMVRALGQQLVFDLDAARARAVAENEVISGLFECEVRTVCVEATCQVEHLALGAVRERPVENEIERPERAARILHVSEDQHATGSDQREQRRRQGLQLFVGHIVQQAQAVDAGLDIPQMLAKVTGASCPEARSMTSNPLCEKK